MSASLPLWDSPPEILELGHNEAHVWRTTLDLPISRVRSLEQTLTADEITRAEQFHFQKDRMHFIVARGLLRTILSRYLATNPRTLRFCYSQYGKPTLARESGSDASLCFNVTHSLGVVLYAITRSRAIGIDLERIRLDVACESIAEHFFSPYEARILRTVPTDLRSEAFFRCWTRKEAYLKARGIGLSIALGQFDVSVLPGELAALLGTREKDQNISQWSLNDLYAGEGYVAALAVEGHPHLQYWEWSEL